MRRKYLKKKLYTYVLLAFFSGILYVNLMARELGEVNEVFDTYTLKQYQNMDINTGRYFMYILRIRIVPVGIILGLVFTRFRKIAAWGTIGWTCFLCGFLMADAILGLGIKGSLLCLVAGFPHFLFYFIAYAIILWYGLIYPQGHWNLTKTVFITGTMLIGIFLEAYLNPVIIKLFIAIL